MRISIQAQAEVNQNAAARLDGSGFPFPLS
jgi:hypothetical protein